MEHTPYFNNYLSCTDIVIAAQLKRLGIRLELVWNQTGLCFEKREGYLFLDPNYESLDKVLPEYFHVEWHEHRSTDVSELVRKLEAYVLSGGTAGVVTDLYYLSYLPLLQGKNHESHMIEVLGCGKDTYQICDHYYRFVGEIPKQVLHSALSSYQEYFSSYKDAYFIYLDKNENDHDARTSFNYRRPIDRNIAHMKGNDCEIDMAEGMAYGISALPLLKEELTLQIKQNSQALDLSSKMISEMSNSRYNAHLYYRLCGLHELVEPAKVAYQHWRILGNMIARGLLRDEFDVLKDKMIARLEKVVRAEEAYVEAMEQWANQYPDWKEPTHGM